MGKEIELYYKNSNGSLFCGNILDVLKALPSESVDCVVTSPPYWGLRAYGTEPQIWGGDENCEHEWIDTSYVRNNDQTAGAKQQTNIEAIERDTPIQNSFCSKCHAWRGEFGLEPTPELYVEHMVGIFREVKRVMKREGTLWLNLGDSYNGSGGDHKEGGKNDTGFQGNLMRGVQPKQLKILKPKDLCGIPWRVAFALQADGWWLRSDIIFHKQNPMPESVTDRPTKAHEYVFLLTKSAKYYYDNVGVKEPYTAPLNRYGGDTKKLTDNLKGEDNPYQSAHRERDMRPDPNGRNLRSVWTITTQPFPEAHFATFPEALITPPIKAGTSEKGVCPECGKAWVRVVEIYDPNKRLGKGYHDHKDDLVRGQRGVFPAEGAPIKQTTGWRPQCTCNKPPVPAIVMDVFMGSGTTAVVAQSLHRNWIGVELNSEYCEIAKKRIKKSTSFWRR